MENSQAWHAGPLSFYNPTYCGAVDDLTSLVVVAPAKLMVGRKCSPDLESFSNIPGGMTNRETPLARFIHH